MPKNCTFLLGDPSILSNRLYKTFEDLQKVEEIMEGSVVKARRLTLSWGTIRMVPEPPEKLKDLHDFLVNFTTDHMRDGVDDGYIFDRIYSVKWALNCVIDHPEDEKSMEAASQFLLDFNRAVAGMVFVLDSLIDFNEEPLVGVAFDARESKSAKAPWRKFVGSLFGRGGS
jgi:hypothetical protein